MPEIYIATNGNDHWTGFLPEPSANGNDGPLASIAAAKRMAFELIRRGRVKERITVRLRGGRYTLRQPLTFDSHESGNVTFAAYPNEEPILEGGVRIRSWEEAKIHNTTAWVADVSSLVAEIGRPFRSLFVNGRRASRPRLPKSGYYHTAESGTSTGTRRFVSEPGDLSPTFFAKDDVETVALHWWIEERLPIIRYESHTGIVTSSRSAVMSLSKGTRYYLDNVFSALTEPGEWYLDSEAGLLYYLPLDGEIFDSVEIVVPVIDQFLRVVGDLESGQCVEGLTFENLSFEYADWIQPCAWAQWWDPLTPPNQWRPRDSCRHFIINDGGDPHDERASNPQGAYNVPGVLHFEAARNCTVENCRIEHIGFYGIDLREGCHAIQIIGNNIRDMGAGGIKMDGGGPESPLIRRTGKIRVSDNTICSGGRVFPSAMGILSMFSDSNVIVHNEIYDLFQTGISLGWKWDYEEQVARDLHIEKNHIHHIGQGLLSDMGGIYTLGVLSGTTIRGNYIHDMASDSYGACGIYLDQSSSNIAIEGNVVFRVGEAMSLHWVRSNYIRNNIFAFSQKQSIFLGREPHLKWVDYPQRGLLLERNIFLLSGEPAYSDYEGFIENLSLIQSDLNLYWDVKTLAPIVYRYAPWHPKNITFAWGYTDDTNGNIHPLTLTDWQKTGQDSLSLIGNPGFAAIETGDVSFSAQSLAHRIGFKPIDLSDIGPRPPEKRLVITF